MGPHKDVVGIWQKAAKKEGLYFGVSEHLGASYTWFQMAHKADTAGAMKGIPYDGNDPAIPGSLSYQSSTRRRRMADHQPGLDERMV